MSWPVEGGSLYKLGESISAMRARIEKAAKEGKLICKYEPLPVENEMNTKSEATTPTPTQGHTPQQAGEFGEPWEEYSRLGDEHEPLPHATLIPKEYARARLCVNSCTGLTAEQVEAIPYERRCLYAWEEMAEGPMTPEELKAIPAKLAAFEAMREALIDFHGKIKSLADGCENITPKAVKAQIRGLARAALKMVERSEIPSTDGADDCEGET